MNIGQKEILMNIMNQYSFNFFRFFVESIIPILSAAGISLFITFVNNNKERERRYLSEIRLAIVQANDTFSKAFTLHYFELRKLFLNYSHSFKNAVVPYEAFEKCYGYQQECIQAKFKALFIANDIYEKYKQFPLYENLTGFIIGMEEIIGRLSSIYYSVYSGDEITIDMVESVNVDRSSIFIDSYSDFLNSSTRKENLIFPDKILRG